MDEHRLYNDLDYIKNKIDKIDDRLYNYCDRTARIETTIQGWIKVVLFFAAPLSVGIIVSIIKLYTGGK